MAGKSFLLLSILEKARTIFRGEEWVKILYAMPEGKFNFF